MIESMKKENKSAMAQTYEFLCNLLAGDRQAQWVLIPHLSSWILIYIQVPKPSLPLVIAIL
jgi:hypothetical protein